MGAELSSLPFGQDMGRALHLGCKGGWTAFEVPGLQISLGATLLTHVVRPCGDVLKIKDEDVMRALSYLSLCTCTG